MNTTLQQAQTLWSATRRGYRDGMLAVARLLRQYMAESMTTGNGLNEQHRHDAGVRRDRFVSEAATALSVSVRKINELLRVAAVDAIAGSPYWGTLSYSCIRVLRAVVHRPNRGRVSRNKGAQVSDLETWEARYDWSVELITLAIKHSWDSSQIEHEIHLRLNPRSPAVSRRMRTTAMQRYDVLTTGEIAKFAKVSPRTVTKWIDSGKLKGFRIPGSHDRRVTKQSLVGFFIRSKMPMPDELLNDTVNLAFGIDQHEVPEGYRLVNSFELGYTLAKSDAQNVMIGDNEGLSIAIAAAKYILSLQANARLTLVVSADNALVGYPRELFVERHSRS